MRTQNLNKLPLFGRKLRLLRQGRHLTQEKLAEEVGMTRQMIAYLEARSPNPTAEVIRKFADFFNVSADELLYEESEGANKQGPKSTLQRQFEQLQKLPKSKQKIVSDMIEGVVK